jgi:hypothetical protein
MRTVLLASIAVILTVLVAAAVLVDRETAASFPPVAPDVEPACAAAMQRSPPDVSFGAASREEQVRRYGMRNVTLGELKVAPAGYVRVAGVLHVEFEWIALYPSRSAIEQRTDAPWVALDTLWPDEPSWKTRGPSISDRCVIVEGSYEGGASGHMNMFNGVIRVQRLDVWSIPEM